MQDNKKINQITESGITIREELEILASDINDEVFGPFTSTEELKKSLNH